jgi:D-serine deaminase-like pyridoxal phosphate-dependent protein
VRTSQLSTPALLIDADAFEHNLAVMAERLPGSRLRPHVKAHKCTAIAREQARHGHPGFTCATPREVLGMAAAGLGQDLLLANETVDSSRLRAMADAVTRGDGEVRVTVAVDSPETVAAAADAGIRDVLVDVDIGLPRCGCPPDDAGRIADLARAAGLEVRGVMGYEGHLMMVADDDDKQAKVDAAVDLLLRAHTLVGGAIVSSGGTGTHHLHPRVTEVQAGSYALMDTQYAGLGFPFRNALHVLGTVVNVHPKWFVADVGLKALGMDHGNSTVPGAVVWYHSDEHVTCSPEPDGPLAGVRVGDRIRVVPAHVDPTMAYHERVHVVRDDDVLDTWEIDLRGW